MGPKQKGGGGGGGGASKQKGNNATEEVEETLQAVVRLHTSWGMMEVVFAPFAVAN